MDALPTANKTALARSLGIARASLYYVSRKTAKDWAFKIAIEEVLQDNPSYGHRRIADHLTINKKRVRRVMKLFGIKPYRRRGRKSKKKRSGFTAYPNLLQGVIPSYQGHVWASDFTELNYRGIKLYVATVIDLFTREIVGVAVSARKGSPLTLQALWAALLHRGPPAIFHSDNGREYDARSFTTTLTSCGSTISRSRPASPWENGYQESFYDKFKVDLGDPGRFATMGELVAEIYRTIYAYNHTRIHSAFRMPPAVFAHKAKIAA